MPLPYFSWTNHNSCCIHLNLLLFLKLRPYIATRNAHKKAEAVISISREIMSS